MHIVRGHQTLPGNREILIQLIGHRPYFNQLSPGKVEGDYSLWQQRLIATLFKVTHFQQEEYEKLFPAKTIKAIKDCIFSSYYKFTHLCMISNCPLHVNVVPAEIEDEAAHNALSVSMVIENPHCLWAKKERCGERHWYLKVHKYVDRVHSPSLQI